MLLGTKMQHSQMQALDVLENRAQSNLCITYDVYMDCVMQNLIIIEQKLQTCALQASLCHFVLSFYTRDACSYACSECRSSVDEHLI